MTDGSNSYFTQDDIDQFLLKDLKLDPKSSTPKSITDKLSFALGQPSSDQVVDIDGDNDFRIAKPSGGYIFFTGFASIMGKVCGQNIKVRPSANW